MYAHFESQVTKYKDYFPKNRPSGALDNTILMLRLIYRNQVYVAAHPNREKSFTQHLRNLMSESAIAKYESFKEITSPFDKNDLDAVIDGLIRLAEMMRDDITADVEYYRKPFQKQANSLQPFTRCVANIYVTGNSTLHV